MALKYWFVFLLIGIFLVSGCVSEQAQQANQPQTPTPAPTPTPTQYKIYIEPVPYGILSHYQSSIRDAMGYWERTKGINFIEISDPSQADIYVQWVKEWGGERLGQTYKAELVQVGVGDSVCLSTYQQYTYDSVVLIAEHELGHAIGLGHSDVVGSLMYPFDTYLVYENDWKMNDVLPAGYVKWVPVCTKNSNAQYTFTVTSSVPINVDVVPTVADAKKIGTGETYQHYSDCYQTSTTYYNQICIIPQGVFFTLYNPSLLSTAQIQYSAKETQPFTLATSG